MPDVPGYRFADPTLPPSALSLTDLDELRASLLLGDEDIAALRASGRILAPHVDEILDVWYGFVGSQPHLLRYFSNAAQQPQPQYLARVRARFGQWIRDTARAEYDEAWLKAVLLTVILWSHPYVGEGTF